MYLSDKFPLSSEHSKTAQKLLGEGKKIKRMYMKSDDLTFCKKVFAVKYKRKRFLVNVQTDRARVWKKAVGTHFIVPSGGYL